MNSYEDIRVLLTRLDSIAAAPEYQPMPESAEIIVEDHQDFHEMFGYLGFPETELWEAEYQGRKVPLNKPMRGRKSFRARHNCANPGPKTKARYWSCRAW